MGKYDMYWPMLLHTKDEYDSFNFLGESSTTINILPTQYIKLNMLNLRIINRSNITLIRNNIIKSNYKNY